MRGTLTAAFIVLTGSAASAQDAAAPDAKALIDTALIGEMRSVLDNEVVAISVAAQNVRYAGVDEAKILRLDEEWVAERGADDKPLIAATLSSPLSTYLVRTQARALGLYAEIFVMDRNGLNVGQSSITSDFWQGDEAKFQKSFGVGPTAVFIDDPEWDEDNRIWRAQVSMTIVDATAVPVGSATFEVNLNELQRRRLAGS
ncbi:MAG TPA: hypothetical protein VMP03_06550 [Methylomirabilota bacterium]|nr:hypothetical protein [Methylomirabilota bacterium]